MDNKELKEILDFKQAEYQNPKFIETDPIQIPKQFSRKEDIEISGFIAATLAWGQRPQIIKKSQLWMQLMDYQPYNFITQASEKEFSRFSDFVYRTFNSDDAMFFLASLRNIYLNYGGLEAVFSKYPKDMKASIAYFRSVFVEINHLKRSEKHLANTDKGSAAKRINMYLRWMVRDAKLGVDFGLWKAISSADLMIPLDTHSGRVARKLGLLHRTQSDWKAVEELTKNLRLFDPNDPIKYDFALFGMGVFEKF
jgi:uncharacterized protein (TIGR02757 family)